MPLRVSSVYRPLDTQAIHSTIIGLYIVAGGKIRSSDDRETGLSRYRL